MAVSLTQPIIYRFRRLEGTAGGVGAGIWVDQPWKPVAMGVIYFGLVGWYELRWRRWYKPGATVTPG